MQSLSEYIAESKALHQNVNIEEKLIVNSPSWVSEKLVINKNYKSTTQVKDRMALLTLITRRNDDGS